ncbi:hypothetical protein BH11ARM2_BH11ARM2_05000 [soil metagenome]
MQFSRRGLAQTFAITPNDRTIAGYFSLSAGSIEFSDLDDVTRSGKPRLAIPSVLLARLAVDKSFQGQGLGHRLTGEAIRKVLDLSEEVGIALLVVDALHPRAAEFYFRYGFTPTPENPLRLTVPLRTLRKR